MRVFAHSSGHCMAGHSQFKNIMHKKGRQDAIRSKLFSKLAREITVAAKLGLPDPAMNARLRAAVLAARAENMPKDNIERAIKKAAAADTETYDEVRYEGYAPGGVAVIVEALTDNRNRTAGEVRSYFAKAGGSLAETGAVSFMFDRVGLVVFDRKVADEETMLEAAIEAGADDVVSGPEEHEVTTSIEALRDAQKALEAKFGEPLKASIVWRPQSTVAVDDEAGEKILRLIGSLEDNDDVQNVTANFEILTGTFASYSVGARIVTSLRLAGRYQIMRKTPTLAAVAALGLSIAALQAGVARASVVFDFSGTCGGGCVGTATGALTLTDAYTPGADITTADFVSVQYSSSDISFDITSADSPFLVGGLNSDGSLNAAAQLIIEASAGLPLFQALPGEFLAADPSGIFDTSPTFQFTLVSAGVPEPATWAMLLIGFAGLGAMTRSRRRLATASPRT